MPQSEGTLATNYQVDIAIRDHRLTADEPKDNGGQNKGPSPTELICAALTACTSITLKMYVDRKQWPVERIHVAVIYDTSDKKQPVFRRTIEVVGDFDQAQRDRILAIANGCPVHKILSRANTIETSLES